MDTLYLLFNKTFRAFKIYPKGHDIPKYFLRQLWDAFKGYFQTKDSLTWFFEKNKCLDPEGKEVYVGEENDDNVGWVFYRSGIKGISFNNALNMLELQDFFEAIQTSLGLKDKHALIYELSQKEFTGISFEFIPDFLHDESVFIPETYQEFVKLREKEPKGEPLDVNGQIVASVEIPIIIDSREVFSLSAEEEKLLNEELLLERSISHLNKFLSYLPSLIEFETMEGAKGFIKPVEELVLLLLNNQEIEKASQILQTLKFIKGELRNTEKAELIGSLFERLCDYNLLEEIVKSYIDNKAKELETFLAQLPPRAGIILFKIAIELSTKNQRMVVLRALDQILKDNRREVLDYIYRNADNHKILISGLEFIALSKAKEAKDFLLELQLRSDTEVRKTLLEAISAVEGDLTPFFYDPNLDVRMNTYIEMKRNPKKAFAHLVAERLKSSDLFFKMDPLEKKQFLNIVPEYLDYQVVENALRDVFNQNLTLIDKLSKARKYYETLQFLVNSLVESKSRKVYLLLVESLKNAKGKKIREMFSEALKQFKEM